MKLKENFWEGLQFFVFIIAGVCMGNNDFMFSNAKMYLTQFFMHIIDPANYEFPSIPPTMWELNPMWGFISATTFLSLPAVMLAIGVLAGRMAKLPFKTQIVYIIAGLFLYSAFWDWHFANLIYAYWTPEMRGTEVAWLPLGYIGGKTYGISFTWEFGFWFILMRIIIALILIYWGRKYKKLVMV